MSYACGPDQSRSPGKTFGHLVNDVSSLADFQVSIERAASLLDGIAAYGENERPVDAPNQRQAVA
jgi:hypothetical protein